MNQPLQFGPNRVWRTYRGGAVLDRMAGIVSPHDDHWPEDWIASTTRASNPQPAPPDEGLSRCTVGGADRWFRDVLAADPDYYLGAAHRAAHGLELRMLVKYLDAAVRLHIQAHPTADYARRHLGSPHGKAEAYYILSVRPDCVAPHVWIGFQRPPSRAQLRDWLVNQRLDSLRGAFDPVPVAPGDCLFIPGGVPHAIGAGVCMVELMEPSDWVVRCEFEHAGYVLPESARYLCGDVDLSVGCFDLTPRSVEQVRAQCFVKARARHELGTGAWSEELIDGGQTPAFRMRRIEVATFGEIPGGEPFIGLVVAGSCQIGGVSYPRYSRLFFLAAVSCWPISAGSGGCTLLQCLPPGC
jgi:mannose-6-phosphate isomerase